MGTDIKMPKCQIPAAEGAKGVVPEKGQYRRIHELSIEPSAKLVQAHRLLLPIASMSQVLRAENLNRIIEVSSLANNEELGES